MEIEPLVAFFQNNTLHLANVTFNLPLKNATENGSLSISITNEERSTFVLTAASIDMITIEFNTSTTNSIDQSSTGDNEGPSELAKCMEINC